MEIKDAIEYLKAVKHCMKMPMGDCCDCPKNNECSEYGLSEKLIEALSIAIEKLKEIT